MLGIAHRFTSVVHRVYWKVSSACISTISATRTPTRTKSIKGHEADDPKEWQTEGLVKPAPSQLRLIRKLKEIFPNEIPVINKRNIRHEDTAKIPANVRKAVEKGQLEVDISYENLNLYLEYQDPCHYITMYYINEPLSSIQEKDAHKKKDFQQKRKTLIQLPCWWDGSMDSLVATIKSARPDLLKDYKPSSPPVDLETIPEDFFVYYSIPDLGEVMHPIHVYPQKLAEFIKGWLGEKYDGMRAIWNPNSLQLYSRYGKIVPLPDSIRDQMPNQFLDLEIWCGPGRNDLAAKFKSNSNQEVDWSAFWFVAFDVPNPKYIETKIPFEDRFTELLTVVNHEHPFIKVPARIDAESKATAASLYDHVIKRMGEGIIIDTKGSIYEHGKSYSTYKIAAAQEAEGLVRKVLPKKVEIELPTGTVFVAPLPSKLSVAPNNVVTFRFKRLFKERPTLPSILRERSDVTWSEIKAGTAQYSALQQARRQFNYSRYFSGSIDELRDSFILYAQEHKFDHLDPENWYRTSGVDVMAIPGVKNMLHFLFNGSYVVALRNLFPVIKFDILRFSKLPQGFWKSTANLRLLFDDFAASKGFDPLVVENWYANTPSKRNTKRAVATVSNLVLAYPDLEFDLAQFRNKRDFYHLRENRIEFFKHVAKRLNFDCNVAANWYSLPLARVKKEFQGGHAVMAYYSSYQEALQDAFPVVHFDSSSFPSQGRPKKHN